MSDAIAGSLPWEADEKSIANKYLNERCGTLHLEWVLNHYWGLVTQKVILPGALAIYDALVKNGNTEENSRMWGDADGDIFHIPSKDKKVFVHTTQCRDYLYIIQDSATEHGGRFDIRRIYRQWNREDWTVQQLRKTRSFKKIMEHAETLSEYHDDNYQYSNRPSLEAYRKIDFQIPFLPKDHMKENSHYGDFRDGGFILSYEFFRARTSHPTVEGSKYVFTDLETIATCYMPSMAVDLEIEIPGLEGYK